MEQQKKEFQYELAKNKLVFTVMQESTATFYPGKLNILDQEAADREKAQTVNMEAMKNFRFIQNFRDEFLELGEKEKLHYGKDVERDRTLQYQRQLSFQ